MEKMEILRLGLLKSLFIIRFFNLFLDKDLPNQNKKKQLTIL